MVETVEVDELTQQEVTDQEEGEERSYLHGTNTGSGAHERHRRRKIREIRRDPEKCIVIESKHWESFKEELALKQVVNSI